MARFPGYPGPAAAFVRALLLLSLVAFPGAGTSARAGAGAGPVVLSGIVLDPRGHVLPGVEIRLAPAGRIAPPVAAVRTDTDGRFAVRGIEPGVYRLVAIKGGYAVFVDRVDTLLRRTLELVLHPATTVRAPGNDAPDRSWALRLPGRDVLEDLHPGDDPGEWRGHPRFAIDLAPASLDTGAGGRGDGVDLAVRGTVATVSGGKIAGAVLHRGARGREGLLERNDRLALTAAGPWGPHRSALEVRAGTWRRESRRAGEPGEAARADARGREVRGRLRGGGAGGSWEVVAGWRTLHGSQEEIRRAASLSSVGLELRRTTGASAAFRGRMILRDARRAGVRGPGGDLVAAGLAAGEALPLEVLEGTSLEMGLANEWSLPGSVRLSVAFDGLTVDGRGTRWTGWSRAEWRPGGGWSMAAAAGIAAGGEVGSEPTWFVGIGRDMTSWSWSLRRTRGAGPVPADAAGQVPFLLLSREARLDTWTGGVTTRLGPAGVALHLVGTAGRLAGGAVPLLPGDVPLVPLVSRARGRLLALDGGIALFAGSTRIGFTWQELVDRRGDGMLLAGGGRWIRREVRLTQRLGLLSGRGFACDLLLGYGRTRVEDAAGSGSSPARVALLHRSRVAGGLRVAF